MNSLRYLWLLIVTALGAFAQGNLGGLTGVVSDTSSAVVPEVKVTLTSEQTNLSHSRCQWNPVVEKYQWESRLQPGSALRRNLGPTRRDTRIPGADLAAL